MGSSELRLSSDMAWDPPMPSPGWAVVLVILLGGGGHIQAPFSPQHHIGDFLGGAVSKAKRQWESGGRAGCIYQRPSGGGHFTYLPFWFITICGAEIIAPIFFTRGKPDSERLIKWPRVTQPVSDRKQDSNPSLAPNLGSSHAVLCMGFGVDMRGSWGAAILKLGLRPGMGGLPACNRAGRGAGRYFVVSDLESLR